jgi:hypothetical protein
VADLRRALDRTKPKRRKNLGYQLVPIDPSYNMLKALAGDPVFLAASDEAELRRRYAEMLKASPVR